MIGADEEGNVASCGSCCVMGAFSNLSGKRDGGDACKAGATDGKAKTLVNGYWRGESDFADRAYFTATPALCFFWLVFLLRSLQRPILK